MGGRFGKYGDLKRRMALQRGRKEKARLDRAPPVGRIHRRRTLPPATGHAAAEFAKTFKTALAAIPPRDCWGPIQELRRRYDSRFQRWMPHITLIYPFRRVEAFEQIAPLLDRACRTVPPFEIRLERFSVFSHGRRKATVYLIPEPVEPLKTLHAALLAVAPDCNDAGRFGGEYTPHLSVGQVRSEEAGAFCRRWQADWKPVIFTLTHIGLIYRDDPPNDIFHEHTLLPLGAR